MKKILHYPGKVIFIDVENLITDWYLKEILSGNSLLKKSFMFI